MTEIAVCTPPFSLDRCSYPVMSATYKARLRWKTMFFPSAVLQTGPRDTMSEIGLRQNAIHKCSAECCLAQIVKSLETFRVSLLTSSLFLKTIRKIGYGCLARHNEHTSVFFAYTKKRNV